jgi:hypothetical protein
MIKDMVNYWLTKSNPEGEQLAGVRNSILSNFLNENQYNTGDELSKNYPWMPSILPVNSLVNGGTTSQMTPNLRAQLLYNNALQYEQNKQRDAAANITMPVRGEEPKATPDGSQLKGLIQRYLDARYAPTSFSNPIGSKPSLDQELGGYGNDPLAAAQATLRALQSERGRLDSGQIDPAARGYAQSYVSLIPEVERAISEYR